MRLPSAVLCRSEEQLPSVTRYCEPGELSSSPLMPSGHPPGVVAAPIRTIHWPSQAGWEIGVDKPRSSPDWGASVVSGALSVGAEPVVSEALEPASVEVGAEDSSVEVWAAEVSSAEVAGAEVSSAEVAGAEDSVVLCPAPAAGCLPVAAVEPRPNSSPMESATAISTRPVISHPRSLRAALGDCARLCMVASSAGGPSCGLTSAHGAAKAPASVRSLSERSAPGVHRGGAGRLAAPEPRRTGPDRADGRAGPVE